MKKDDCLICDKHRGISHQPPGGYIYTGTHFSICHAPLTSGPLGTLFIESNRHFLDYADMNTEETTAYSAILSRIYDQLRAATDAVRIYQVTLLEGIPHFHTWLVPRRENDTERGMKFLSSDRSCELEDVQLLVNNLKSTFSTKGANEH